MNTEAVKICKGCHSHTTPIPRPIMYYGSVTAARRSIDNTGGLAYSKALTMLMCHYLLTTMPSIRGCNMAI